MVHQILLGSLSYIQWVSLYKAFFLSHISPCYAGVHVWDCSLHLYSKPIHSFQGNNNTDSRRGNLW